MCVCNYMFVTHLLLLLFYFISFHFFLSFLSSSHFVKTTMVYSWLSNVFISVTVLCAICNILVCSFVHWSKWLVKTFACISVPFLSVEPSNHFLCLLAASKWVGLWSANRIAFCWARILVSSVHPNIQIPRSCCINFVKYDIS